MQFILSWRKENDTKPLGEFSINVWKQKNIYYIYRNVWNNIHILYCFTNFAFRV